MIQTGILAKTVERPHRPCFRIQTPKNQARDTSLQNRSDAHDARLQGHIESAFFEPPALEPGRGSFERQYLCVSNRALQPLALISSPTYHLPVVHHDRPNRNVAE